jgi:hypothetical protein
MSALARKRPFALTQHVSVADHQGIGNPNDVWNWKSPVPTHMIKFDDSAASQRTRTNTQGIADVGEMY